MDIQESCNIVSSHRQSKFDKNKQPNNEEENKNEPEVKPDFDASEDEY